MKFSPVRRTPYEGIPRAYTIVYENERKSVLHLDGNKPIKPPVGFNGPPCLIEQDSLPDDYLAIKLDGYVDINHVI